MPRMPINNRYNVSLKGDGAERQDNLEKFVGKLAWFYILHQRKPSSKMVRR